MNILKVNIITKNYWKNMWHKKILCSIDISHYLNDVFKLEGAQLDSCVRTILSHAGPTYEHYCRQYPESSGTLARALKKLGVIPGDYIEPPLTYAIDEISWAITHGYVHPREVIVIKHKDSVNLLKDSSNDILKTLLSDNKIDSDPKLVQYLETELNIREATNVEEFEDFNIKPANNKEFMDLKTSSGLEAKAAKLLFVPKKISELEEPQIHLTQNPLSGEGISSFRRSNTAIRHGSLGTYITNTETTSNDTSQVQVTSIGFSTLASRCPRGNNSVIDRYLGRMLRATQLNCCIIFRVDNTLVFSRVTTDILAYLGGTGVVSSNTFYLDVFSSQEQILRNYSAGLYRYLRTLPHVNSAKTLFAEALAESGEEQPASGVEMDSDTEE